MIFDEDARTVATAQREFRQIFPSAGLVEHDPLEIWETQRATMIDAFANSGLARDQIAAAGITNQRETIVCWDRRTGEPCLNAIVWQDRRTAEFCNSLRADYAELIRRKTGLEIDAYFSASKIKWILDHVDGARRAANRGDLLAGTIDTWLIWKLTSGKTHVTDVSNASRTMLFSLETLDWDDELLAIFEIPREILPSVVASSEIVGEIESIDELRGIPIAGIAGDQQAALFGQQCFEIGLAKNTYGTGCFLLQNIGEKPVVSKHRLLTTIAWRVGEKTEFALEGSVFIAGAAIQWLRDSLGIISSADEVESLARSVDGCDGVHFVPAFTGLGAPYWDQDARGMITGLSRGSGRAHIVRAALESIAFQTADVLDAMDSDSGVALAEVRVDGGVAKNDFLLQFQSDILGIPVVRGANTETTALGAAMLAGLAAGVWRSKGDFSAFYKEERRFEPSMSQSEAAERLASWRNAVRRVRSSGGQA